MKNLASFLTQNLKRRNAPTLAFIALFGLVMSCSSVLAQSGAGSIQGTVTDATGAVIPAPRFTLSAQGWHLASIQNQRHRLLQVPSLFTGTYVVTITAPGMKTSKTSIELLVGQNAAVNASLSAGAVTQQVEVAADMVQLTTTDNGSISSTLENSRINQLPMNGRNVISLASQTTPGLESCSQSSSCPNGLMGQAMEYVADGASLNNREFGGTHVGSSQMPDPDSVQEVRVETTGAGAQFATPATGILTTKSVTNGIHGTLFETARNNASASPGAGQILPTSSRLRISAMSLVLPPAGRSLCLICTTAGTRVSGSSPTSATRCAATPIRTWWFPRRR
jgi:hypothetical protein